MDDEGVLARLDGLPFPSPRAECGVRQADDHEAVETGEDDRRSRARRMPRHGGPVPWLPPDPPLSFLPLLFLLRRTLLRIHPPTSLSTTTTWRKRTMKRRASPNHHHQRRVFQRTSCGPNDCVLLPPSHPTAKASRKCLPCCPTNKANNERRRPRPPIKHKWPLKIHRRGTRFPRRLRW